LFYWRFFISFSCNAFFKKRGRGDKEENDANLGTASKNKKRKRFVKPEKRKILSNALVYGILIAFLACSYFIFADIGSGRERMKLFAITLISMFIIALILLVVSVTVVFLIRVAYYATIVFLIVAGLVIICLMLAGHEITAFGWPIAAGGAVGVLFMLFLILLLLGIIMVLPLLLPAFITASAIYPVSDMIAFFVGIFVFVLTAIGLPCVLSILGGLYEPEEEDEYGGTLSTIASLSMIGEPLYLPFNNPLLHSPINKLSRTYPHAFSQLYEVES